MISRIDVSGIVAAHLKSMRKIGKGPDYVGVFLFFGIPLIIALILVVWLKLEFKNHVSNLLTVVSIVGGFCFNLLAIIYNVLEKVKTKYPDDAVKNFYAKVVHANISFTILVAMGSTFLLSLYGFDYPATCTFGIFKLILSLSIFFLLGVFFLTLLMVLKRIFIIMSNEETE